MTIAEDIRTRSDTEEREREDLLKIFVKNVPAGVAMLDREMRYLQVSASVRTMASMGPRSSGVLITTCLGIFLSDGKTSIVVPYPEKRFAPTKTLGSGNMAPCGCSGRFARGPLSRASGAEF